MSTRSRVRLFILRVLVVSLFLTLFGRLSYLSLAPGEAARRQPDTRVREVVLPAVRGAIVDVAGRPLARNRTAVAITVDRSALRRQDDRGMTVLTRLARVLGVPVQQLSDSVRLCTRTVRPPCWNGSPYTPVTVSTDASPAVALAVEEHREDFPAVAVVTTALRDYPGRVLAAHALGYLSPVTAEDLASVGPAGGDLVGRAGLESTYDEALRGSPGVRRVTVDAADEVTAVESETPSVAGATLVLNLDATVQALTESALRRAVQRARARRDDAGVPYRAPTAAAVVLEARTGRVVAMASVPSYDPTAFVGGISTEDYRRLNDTSAGLALLSRATSEVSAPASTFKVVAAAAAVSAGSPLDGSYACPASYPVGNRSFLNFDSVALGSISLRTALVQSCDTVFYGLGHEQWLADERRIAAGDRPAEAVVRMAEAFGFGRRTGVDLPGEATGTVPDREQKRAAWAGTRTAVCQRARGGYPEVPDRARAALLTALARETCADGGTYRGGDAVNVAIGQGDLAVTPLQLAVAYAAVANGGTLYEPRLAKALVGADGRVLRTMSPVVRGRLPVRPEVLGYLRDALSRVPVEGTAACAFGSVAGCGPAFPLDLLPVAGKTGTGQVTGRQDTSWFASWAPANDPRYVVVATLAEAGPGGTAAAPAVREIYEGIYGLAGRPAALPGGRLPSTLPLLTRQGAAP